jgi:hypothetical protein
MRARFEPENAALAAGLSLAALDWSLLLGAARPAGAGPLLCALALPLFAALLGALLWRISGAASRLLGRGSEARLLVGGVLALPIVLYVSYRLFQGTGISRRWYAPYGPYIVAPILLGLSLLAIALGARLLPLSRRSRAGRIGLGLALLAGAGLLALADHRLYPHQYAYLHGVLLLCAGLGICGAAWLALPAGEPGAWRRVAPLLLAAAIPGVVVAALFGLHGQAEMQLLDERTQLSGRLAALGRALLDRDGDHYSVVFGEQDCDNHDAAVHPFAVDVPGNGLDEDCDGQDAKPPPAKPAKHAPPDVAEYRKQLAALTGRPGVRKQLEQTAGFNVVLVMIDALRADQVLPTAENRQNHPRLLRFLDQSRSFVRAFSTGAGTDIGMATIFTGQLDPFDRQHRSLFLAYHQAGFRTHGIFQREVERWVGRQFSMVGLDGRKVIVNDPGRRDVGTQPTSRQVTDEGIKFLRQQATAPAVPGSRGQFFLWLHYFDAHEHHQIEPARLPEPERFRAPRGRPFYRSLLRFIDEQLGRFLDELASSSLGARTIVVLAGDHGESLGESPQRLPANHGDVLYNPLTHVPLVFHVPGLPPGEVRLPVSLADLCPTLLSLPGLPAAAGSDGLSLLPYLLGAPPDELRGFVRPVLMYETRQHALLLWPWKFIAWQDSGRVELYQLEQDFAETRNLADEEGARAREMARLLAGYRLITIDRLAPTRTDR